MINTDHPVQLKKFIISCMKRDNNLNGLVNIIDPISGEIMEKPTCMCFLEGDFMSCQEDPTYCCVGRSVMCKNKEDGCEKNCSIPCKNGNIIIPLIKG